MLNLFKAVSLVVERESDYEKSGIAKAVKNNGRTSGLLVRDSGMVCQCVGWRGVGLRHLFNNNRRTELPELSEREIKFRPTQTENLAFLG